MALILTGSDDLRRKLAGLKDKDVKAAVRKGTRAGAKLMAAETRKAAPSKSGLLRKSIKVRALKRSRKRIGHMVAVKLPDGAVKVPYAGFVEFGTKRMKAVEFAKDAAKDSGEQALRQVCEEAAAEIERRAAK